MKTISESGTNLLGENVGVRVGISVGFNAVIKSNEKMKINALAIVTHKVVTNSIKKQAYLTK